MAKHTRKKKQQNKLGLSGDVDMKVVSEKKKSTAPAVQKLGTSLTELIDQATAQHQAAVAQEREKKLPRGQRSKAQKSRKVDKLEKALAKADRSVSKVEKRNSKNRQKAALKGKSRE